jgi:hypothetical protein
VADECCGDGDEGKEVFGLAFVTTVKSPAASKPGNGPFHDPAVPSEAFRVFDASAGNTGRDAA